MCRGYGGIAGIEARVFEGTFAYTVVGPVNGKGWVPYIESVEYPPNLWLMPFDLALIISDAWCVRPHPESPLNLANNPRTTVEVGTQIVKGSTHIPFQLLEIRLRRFIEITRPPSDHGLQSLAHREAVVGKLHRIIVGNHLVLGKLFHLMKVKNTQVETEWEHKPGLGPG